MQATIPLKECDLTRFIAAIATFCDRPDLAFIVPK